MDLAKLQLERYRLAFLSVEFNDAWLQADEESAAEERYDCTPDFDVFEPGSADDEYLVRFSVECLPSREAEGACRFVGLSATVWGVFELSDEATEEETQQLIVYNSVAILHGLVRGLLVSATAGCVGGPFLLPALNYVDLMRRKEAEMTEEEGGHPE